jgi:adenylate kinase family enzyme
LALKVYAQQVLCAQDSLPPRLRRVLVAGVSGVGKSTLASRIAAITGGQHTEIDSLYHGPGWAPRENFLQDVNRFTSEDAWTTEWQYPSARALLARRADLLVWLDLPFPVTFARVVRRTLRRRFLREALWNGNVEPPLRTVFTDREHIVRWAIATRKNYRTSIPQVERENPDLVIVRLRSPKDVERWLTGPLVDASL